MDLTTTCPTCGHVEDASASTCSFCGVELALNSEPVQAADAYPATEEGGGGADNPAEGLGGELLIQNTASEKPESVDEAIAHVLASDDEPLELVDAIEIETEVEEKPSGPDKAPETTHPGGSPEQKAPAADHGAEEKVVLPEPVQLTAEASDHASEQNQKPAPAESSAADGGADQKPQVLKEHRAVLARAEALKKKKMAIARAIALKKKKAALKQQSPVLTGVRMQKLLKKYVGQTIGINYDNSAKIASAELFEVNNEYLTVAVEAKKLRYHFPLPTVLSIIEGASEEGVPTGAANEVYAAVIKIYPLVLF